MTIAHQRKKSSARLGAAVALAISGWAGQAQAQWVVVDPANLVFNILHTTTGIVHTGINGGNLALNAINTGMNASRTWDTYKVKETTQSMATATDTLSGYSQNGGLNQHLATFKDTATYQANKCLTKSGCSAADMAAIKQSELLASQAQKRANDGLARGIALQQEQLKEDADRLENLRNNVNNAQGTNSMLSYMAQFQGQQSDQIANMRALMVAQNNAQVARNQAVVNREALEAASATQLRQGTYVKSKSPNSAVTGNW